ncbi:hypothetical protein MYX04_15310, partial [Nitrospiraceae bacterium AH_259_D15_M11_P09]|nr:hypothetical protein [Nitrospiraceae bacterium AH_259_D15_M11_P09]
FAEARVEETSDSRHWFAIVRGRIPFARDPVSISIQPVRVMRVSPLQSRRSAHGRQRKALMA